MEGNLAVGWGGHRGAVTQGFTICPGPVNPNFTTVFSEDLYKAPEENLKIKLSKTVFNVLKNFSTDAIRCVNAVN